MIHVLCDQRMSLCPASEAIATPIQKSCEADESWHGRLAISNTVSELTFSSLIQKPDHHF